MSEVELRDAPLAGKAVGRDSRAAPVSLPRRLIGAAVRFLSYHFVLKRQKTTEAYAAGFRFVVPPTVFHPRYFVTGEYFAGFIATLNLRGRRVADLGTGSGILALAAARAGASTVMALDINPKAAWAAGENARLNGLGDRVTAVCSNLFSAVIPGPLFDVILCNPPYFPGEPARPRRPRPAQRTQPPRHRADVHPGARADALRRADACMCCSPHAPTSRYWDR